VLRIDSSVTEQPPTVSKNISSDFIKAIGKLEDKIINILNLDFLLQKNN